MLSQSGQLQFGVARSNEPLEWKDLKWNGDPEMTLDSTGLAIAVLLQPHNRRSSKAQLVIEEVGYCCSS